MPSSIAPQRSPISMPIREKYHSFSDLFEAEMSCSHNLSRRGSGSSSSSTTSTSSTSSSFVALSNGMVLNSSHMVKQPASRSSSFSSQHTSTSSTSSSSSGSILSKTASSFLPKGLRTGGIRFKDPSSRMFKKSSTLPADFIIVNGSEGSNRHDIWLNGENSEDEGLSLRKVEGRGGRHYS